MDPNKWSSLYLKPFKQELLRTFPSERLYFSNYEICLKSKFFAKFRILLCLFFLFLGALTEFHMFCQNIHRCRSIVYHKVDHNLRLLYLLGHRLVHHYILKCGLLLISYDVICFIRRHTFRGGMQGHREIVSLVCLA